MCHDPFGFQVYIEVKMWMGRVGVRLSEYGKELRLPGFFYADDMLLFGESEEYLNIVVIKCFVEICKRRVQKVNVDVVRKGGSVII